MTLGKEAKPFAIVDQDASEDEQTPGCCCLHFFSKLLRKIKKAATKRQKPAPQTEKDVPTKVTEAMTKDITLEKDTKEEKHADGQDTPREECTAVVLEVTSPENVTQGGVPEGEEPINSVSQEPVMKEPGAGESVEEEDVLSGPGQQAVPEPMLETFDPDESRNDDHVAVTQVLTMENSSVSPCAEEEEEEEERETEALRQPVMADLEASDNTMSDLDDVDDSDSEESSEESPEVARQVRSGSGRTKNSAKKATAPAFVQPEVFLRPRGAVITFRSDVVDPPATLLMGTDKHENDHLLAQATERVVFFHVDDLPSAHIYLQLEAGQGLRDVPRVLLNDAAQLCKANSARGNKLTNVVVVYTLGSNLRKTRQMKAGEVGFVSDRDVRKILVARRDEKVMERLNLTKRKVLSGKSEREKQQRARQRQQQKAEAKELKRKQRQEQQQQQLQDRQDEAAAPDDPIEMAWGIELEQRPATQTTRRQRRSRCHSVEEEEEQTLQTTTRCFPVGAEQRRVLHGCRAQVEHNFDVRVEPPRKGEAEGRGTVTGAPEDVADALVELKKLLYPDRQKADAQARDNKGGKGGSGKGSKAKGRGTKQDAASKQKRKQ